MLGEFGLDDQIALGGELGILEPLEVVELFLSLVGGHPLAPGALVELFDETLSLNSIGNNSWSSRPLDLDGEFSKLEALDWHNLPSLVCVQDVNNNSLVIDDVDDDGHFISKWAVGNNTKASEFDKACEWHEERLDQTVLTQKRRFGLYVVNRSIGH